MIFLDDYKGNSAFQYMMLDNYESKKLMLLGQTTGYDFPSWFEWINITIKQGNLAGIRSTINQAFDNFTR